jgi:hypothetical protein
MLAVRSSCQAASDRKELVMKPGSRKSCLATALVLVVLHCASAGATSVTIHLKTWYGAAGPPKVLVIVRSLESGKGEMSRDLSAPDGSVPPLNLAPGLYEAIATYPYGNWLTQVKDFLVLDKPVAIEFSLNSESVNAVSGNRIHLSVLVLDREGHPVPNAWIIGRDPEAHFGNTTKSDNHGRATVDIPSDRAEVTVLHNGGSYVQPMNIETGIVDCENNCILRETGKVNKTLPKVTVRLP